MDEEAIHLFAGLAMAALIQKGTFPQTPSALAAYAYDYAAAMIKEGEKRERAISDEGASSES